MPEDSAAATACADRDDQLRRGCGVIGLAQSQFHISRNRPGHQQHIRMTRRGDKVKAEPFEIVNRVVQAYDFEFAPVARTGVHFADVK